MRAILIALAGFLMVGAIGLALFALLPNADGGPLSPIEVDSPGQIEPIAPRQVTPPRLTPSTTPAPSEDAGVPEPPPALGPGDRDDD